MTAHRDAVLRELGLAPLWRLRDALRSDGGDSVNTSDSPGADVVASPATPPVAASGRSPADAAAPTLAPRPRRAYAAPAFADAAPRPIGHAPPGSAGPSSDPARGDRIATLDWDALEADIRACSACRLCERRKQAVPGVGDRHADWMFVGEGPGAEEDQRGEPFVGAAGKLLDAMLATIGLKRGERVYIANAVKCRPPHNRTPERDEVAACFPYLARQIELVRPRLLIALGRPAAQALLKAEVSIAAARGKAFRYRDIPVVVTYHPAYLLRNQADKAKVWEDLCFARRLMQEQSLR